MNEVCKTCGEIHIGSWRDVFKRCYCGRFTPERKGGEVGHGLFYCDADPEAALHEYTKEK